MTKTMTKTIAALFVLLLAGTAPASTYEYGWDRPGFDYFSYDMASPRFILCEWRCENDSRCRAWTYVNPGVQGPNARCWLKNRVPTAVKSNCCVSGVM